MWTRMMRRMRRRSTSSGSPGNWLASGAQAASDTTSRTTPCHCTFTFATQQHRPVGIGYCKDSCLLCICAEPHAAFHSPSVCQCAMMHPCSNSYQSILSSQQHVLSRAVNYQCNVVCARRDKEEREREAREMEEKEALKNMTEAERRAWEAAHPKVRSCLPHMCQHALSALS